MSLLTAYIPSVVYSIVELASQGVTNSKLPSTLGHTLSVTDNSGTFGWAQHDCNAAVIETEPA